MLARHGNTSNLLSHLKANHGKLYAEVKATMASKTTAPTSSRVVSANQPTMEKVIEKCQSYLRKGKRWQQLTDAVTFYITKDNLPIYSVEKQGFKHFVKSFDERYKIPSRSYFSRTALPDLYSSTRQKVREEISKVQFFSATTDLWSSEGNQGMKPYNPLHK